MNVAAFMRSLHKYVTEYPIGHCFFFYFIFRGSYEVVFWYTFIFMYKQQAESNTIQFGPKGWLQE